MKLPIQVQLDHALPIYQQIQEQLSQLILSGQLPPGSPLPSIRALAIDLSCSVITTKRAYQELEQKGLIVVKQGLGTFVASLHEIDLELVQKQQIEHAIQDLFQLFRRVQAPPETVEKIIYQHLEVFKAWNQSKTKEEA